MYGIRRHWDVALLLWGIDIGCGLLPRREISEWMMSLDNPAYGGRGGDGWEMRLADTCVEQYRERGGTDGTFTEDEEAHLRDALIDFAVAWLHRDPG